MKSFAGNLCLLFTLKGCALDNKKEPAGTTCLQIEDSLFFANAEFENLLEKPSAKFDRKTILKLAAGISMKFNGTVALKKESSIEIIAAVTDRKLLSPVQEEPASKGDFLSQRASGA